MSQGWETVGESFGETGMKLIAARMCTGWKELLEFQIFKGGL